MSDSQSVSRWIGQLQTGRPEALAHVWKRYYRRLVEYASRKLGRAGGRAADEEDVVSLAFNSFFRRMSAGNFPEIRDREELWRMLAKITQRKAIDQIRQQRRLKRGGLQHEAADGSNPTRVEQLVGANDCPQQLALLKEQREKLMNTLDEGLRVIAEHKEQGYTNVEIAARIQRSVPTVERRLRLIRQKWEQVSRAS